VIGMKVKRTLQALQMGMIIPCILLSAPQSFASASKQNSKQALMSVNDLAKPLTLGERWGKKLLSATKTVAFNNIMPLIFRT
jgi:hypothetical protein